MTSELNRPIESFSGIQTNASLVGDARECCHPCYTGRRAILARNVSTCQHFARSRLTASGNRGYKRLIYLMSDPESVSQYNSIVRLVSFIHEVLLFYLPRVKISYSTIPQLHLKSDDFSFHQSVLVVFVFLSTLPHSLNSFVILMYPLLSKLDRLAIHPYLSPALDGIWKTWHITSYIHAPPILRGAYFAEAKLVKENMHRFKP